MSYILDALRRADAERERGSVPGLHAQPTAGTPQSMTRGSTPARWWVAAAVLGLVLALLLATLLLRRPAVLAPPSEPVADIASPGSASPAASAPIAVALPAATQPVSPPAAPPAARPAKPVIAAAAVPASQAPLRLDKQQLAKAASAVGEARIPELKELPEEVRRELPPLTVGGASYSANAASRMLIINGQVLHEGDMLAPNHVLEQISLKSAVLRFKGTRYSIAY